jgi:WD40 repeat protein
VATFFEGINRSPRQLYSSVLSFAPICALVDVYARERESNCLTWPRDTIWGSCLHVLSGGHFVKPTFSRDGKLLALPLDSRVEIREVTTLRLQKTLECADYVVSVDFHPHDCSLVSGLCPDGTVEEWNISADTHSRYKICEVGGERNFWDGKVAYNADGTRIICSLRGVDGIFARLTEDRSQPLMKMTVPAMKIKHFSLASDGKHVDALLVFEDEPAVLKRWDLGNGDEVKSLQIAMDEIGSAVFSKNNTLLFTGHAYKICVWSLDSDSSTLSTTINANWGLTVAIDVTRSGDVIASAGIDGVIRLIDASSGALLAVYHGHSNWIVSVVFSPQEDRLISTSWLDETARVWDTRKEAWSLNSSSNSCPLRQITFSPNGKFIATIAENDILVWDGRDGSVLCTLTGHTGGVDSLAFSPDNALLASFSPTDGVLLWDVGMKESVPRTLSNSNSIDTHSSFWVVFSATGAQLAVVNQNHAFMEEPVSFQVRIWDVSNSNGADSAESENESFHSKRNNGRCPHFLPFPSNEPLVHVCHLDPYYDNKVIVWDRMTDAVEKHDYNQDSHSSSKKAFGADQGWIVSMKTGRRLFWLPESRRPWLSGSFATHGNLIAIGSKTGVLLLMDMSPFEGI